MRYFRPCGKTYCRAPEGRVPRSSRVKARCPEGCDFAQGSDAPVMAEVEGYLCEVTFPALARPGYDYSVELAGYAAAPLDMWACGICLLAMHLKSTPWREATLLDPGFRMLLKRGLEPVLQNTGNPLLSPPTLRLLSKLLAINPCDRPDPAAALEELEQLISAPRSDCARDEARPAAQGA
mmetsp:Transcript_37939/g.51524  ORF Transcript_37939/g.51524 Transcript_37939/m.51524 type:complete len:180 (-) Transcript_37939:25-564(-)